MRPARGLLDPRTHEFAKQNLHRAGYEDVILVLGDGGLGYAALAPYDRMSITAACAAIPPPLIAQLEIGGRVAAPLLEPGVQKLTLITKKADGIEFEPICDVRYLKLRGEYGT